MKLHYCDLCDCPIHQKKWSLSVIEEEASSLLQSPYQQTTKRKSEDVKEICDTCKKMLDAIFASRKKGLTDLVSLIDEIFHLPTFARPTKKKKEK